MASITEDQLKAFLQLFAQILLADINSVQSKLEYVSNVKRTLYKYGISQECSGYNLLRCVVLDPRMLICFPDQQRLIFDLQMNKVCSIEVLTNIMKYFADIFKLRIEFIFGNMPAVISSPSQTNLREIPLKISFQHGAFKETKAEDLTLCNPPVAHNFSKHENDIFSNVKQDLSLSASSESDSGSDNESEHSKIIPFDPKPVTSTSDTDLKPAIKISPGRKRNINIHGDIETNKKLKPTDVYSGWDRIQEISQTNMENYLELEKRAIANIQDFNTKHEKILEQCRALTNQDLQCNSTCPIHCSNLIKAKAMPKSRGRKKISK